MDHIVAPTPVPSPPPPKARSQVRFASTAVVYTVSRYLDTPPPSSERLPYVTRAPRLFLAK
jgi:hypothetical protein